MGGQGGVLEKFDWDGNLVWQFFYSDSARCLHHDFEVLPNGNILALAFERITRADAIAAGRDTALLAEDELWPEVVVELQPIGSDSAAIVWEWRMWDHLIQDYDNTKQNFGVPANHPELFDLNYTWTPIADWAHANSIDYNPTLDQIVISLNFFDEFVIIDHSTTTQEAATSSGGNHGKGGDILFRYGNPRTFDRGDTSDQVNFRQHDVHWIKDGLTDGGKIMFFNNGNGRPEGAYSSAEIITPLVDGNGSFILEPDMTFAPDSAEWIYTKPVNTDMFSPITSGVQRLSNGNTLGCVGMDGYMFEINAAGNKVWEYQSPTNTSGILAQGDPVQGNRLLFKSKRYLPDFAGFVGRDLTPGAPIELNPDLSFCTLNIQERDKQEALVIYPNPVLDFLNIDVAVSDYDKVATIYDTYGRLVYQNRVEASINVRDLESGVYVLLVGDKVGRFIKQ